ncbi:MAG TPA: RnfABCDGE type electron transport complex subunit D [Oligoflexia bacterium]|nr:RnfABCDGE type electron transport complex subunit D [Oligoflexia bacterium]HMR24624.1 RnfABCDGE type electron transport complex subunit D [Oligoflexia bacterium]
MKNLLSSVLTKKNKVLDARIYQIIFLSSFIGLGLAFKDLSLSLPGLILCLFTAIACQYFFAKLYKQTQISILSAIITSLSICLLTRSNFFWTYPLLAFIAISSKFALRWHQQHIFNPANFAIVFALLFIKPIWISDSLWGHSTSLIIWFMFLGMVVTQKTKVNLPSIAFLLFYFLLTAIKTIYLGFEFLVWAHELQSGALMIFTFFMLSDPKTSPDQVRGQLIYAATIACFSFILKHLLFINHAFFYSLIIACLLSNVVLKKQKYSFNWLS